MKTTTKLNSLSNNDNSNCVISPIKFIVVFITLFSINFSSVAQNQFGIEIASAVTGSGHGTQFSPRLFYTHQKHTVLIGSVINQQKFDLSGLQLEYQHTLCGDNQDILTENLELFCFINSIYKNATLSKNEIRREKILSDDKTNSIENLKYKTVENYIGFGLRLKITNNFLWSNAIGFGGYYSFENNNNNYHDQQAVALLLRTGLSYRFGN